ncbi:MAG: UDP-N-acetylmuramoyl-tripeptide--D-alanyl-D-alanine ligase [Candidatus Zixiibacteriota bacterium]|nr:MAG: UDP-N-acetylmuramoyl-tripeptide--D-alanyl-D-alanine ligase [candidate division Zixibacteria bacterium]
MRFTELAAVTGGKLLTEERAEHSFTGVSIDSRQVQSGQLFMAIRGENKDGHDFIEQAIGNGAAGVVLETSRRRTEGFADDAAVVAVVNSHEAMLRLARSYRDSLAARFVGITGSNGKTTTKELAARLLRAVEKKTYCSAGNLNNLYGVPLAIFAIPQDTREAILELGISTRNEMPRLADLVRPEVIMLTNVGPSHLEFLESVQAVAQAKLELVKRAAPQVPVIVNADDPVLMAELKKVRTDYITFALDAGADFTAEHITRGETGESVVSIEGHRFRLPLVGRHQVYNLLAAYALLRTMGYSLDGIDTFQLALDTAPMRGQRVVLGGITFVADCYNANPESMKAGLQAYFETESDSRRVVILGDMLELGREAERYHRQVGRQLAEYDFELAVLVGAMARFIREGALETGADATRFRYFENSGQAAEQIRELLNRGDLVYIKGSRGIGLETIMDVFDKKQEQI